MVNLCSHYYSSRSVLECTSQGFLDFVAQSYLMLLFAMDKPVWHKVSLFCFDLVHLHHILIVSSTVTCVLTTNFLPPALCANLHIVLHCPALYCALWQSSIALHCTSLYCTTTVSICIQTKALCVPGGQHLVCGGSSFLL